MSVGKRLNAVLILMILLIMIIVTLNYSSLKKYRAIWKKRSTTVLSRFVP